ncbi:SDR family oxidoreductase [Cerasicoccus frondis]|uniref:SDR family oxidoreductase n=1 Tax=Cerasicoccus frondis TaxID=490090 RepID=UPI002852B432|nr:SDR family oxidoreductase [Cerasicoccus frondis]
MATEYPRIAIVTGATSGIGEATVKEFIEAGYAVIGTGRTAAKLEALEAELGSTFAGLAGDGADPAVIDGLFALAKAKFGAEPDIVVVNAGRGLGGSVKDADLSEFEDMLRINVTGAIRLMQTAAQKMAVAQQEHFPKKAADIVVIGSVVGRQVSPFSAVYGGSKFAIHSMAEGLRREVGPLGVRVTTVAPGIVISGFQDVAGYSDEMLQTFEKKFAPMLVGKDIAEAIHHVVALPPHVHMSDIVVRPTRQDYP